MRNIEDVRIFFEDFAKVEAETETLKWKLSYNEYNANIDKANSFYLHPHIEFMALEGERDEDEIELFGGKSFFSNPYPRLPRKLFKISEYTHKKYGKFWVCYTSFKNHTDNQSLFLTEMLFVIQFEESFKIAASSSWSNYTKDGYGDENYEWKHGFGDRCLHFNFLHKPIDIKRYDQPEDYKIGIETYHANI
ncbi:hypothetical protein [Flavivirga algicola]|uniref:Uncharacterized protein n=1 Tax=Flavivirga algicola TaxID=2729136 RepID=A0ABX1RU64_9FLAO|nr:hypothetical protein [Flavivirga algicola]NMH87090.1 hypothetical protein [Flavivirga algicola]